MLCVSIDNLGLGTFDDVTLSIIMVTFMLGITSNMIYVHNYRSVYEVYHYCQLHVQCTPKSVDHTDKDVKCNMKEYLVNSFHNIHHQVNEITDISKTKSSFL